MVSIIVPVYNIASCIPYCIQSLTTQTYQEIEILLVDDGSTDGSSILCDEYAQKDSRIRVIHKPNGGLSSARNAGLDIAAGEWILFVDGDDYLIPTAIAQLMAVSHEHDGIDFIQFLYQETPDTAWQADQTQAANPRVCADPHQMFVYLYEKGGVAASGCTKLFRRTLFDSLRFREGIRHEDEELMTRLLPICKQVVYTDLVLYGYVMREGSIVHTNFNPRHMDIFPIIEERAEMLRSLGYYDLVPETQARMFRTAAWQYCQARKAGYLSEASALKQRLRSLSRCHGLPLSGQYQMLYRLSRVFLYAPEVYAGVRKMLGKT